MNIATRSILLLALCLGLPAMAQEAAPVTAEEQAMLDEEARLDAEDAALESADAAAAAATATATSDPTAPNPAPAFPELKPVLADFGGEAGLTDLMETFMTGLLADPRTGPAFANADQTRVKRQLVEQFCVILGGDCAYSGRDMRSAHAGMKVDRAQFNALVEVLQVAMNQHDVPFRAQNKLLAKLAPMHREVVTQ